MKDATLAQLARGGLKDIKSNLTGHSSIINLEELLTYFMDEIGLCKQCGQNHSHNPEYEDVRTSIDIIAELFKRKKVLEQ